MNTTFFEKVHNHELRQALIDYAEQNGNSLFPITVQEKRWLKGILLAPEAEHFLSPHIRDTLLEPLGGYEPLQASRQVLEKGKPHHDLAPASGTWYEHTRTLRQALAERRGIRLSYRTRAGLAMTDCEGIAYRLEVSTVRREWYLLWLPQEPGEQPIISTPLSLLDNVSLSSACDERRLEEIRTLFQQKRRQAQIQIVPEYNGERRRIFYMFSCFEKEVAYEKDTDTYTIHVYYLEDEKEYILSRIRFLGKRIRVFAPEDMRVRMRDTATRALARYTEETGGVDLCVSE